MGRFFMQHFQSFTGLPFKKQRSLIGILISLMGNLGAEEVKKAYAFHFLRLWAIESNPISTSVLLIPRSRNRLKP
jgi:hypothetical protein